MSRRVISFDLSPGGIAYAINELERFQKEFMAACNALIKQLTDYGSQAARYSLMSYGAVHTQTLMNNIAENTKFDAANRTGIIRADAVDNNGHAYAAYVEFGTGIIGSGDHPWAGEQGWQYDIHNHGEAGWWYLDPWSTTRMEGTPDPDDPEGRDKIRTGLRWTQGEPAKPFMYNAYVNIRNEAPHFAARVFARL